MAIFTGSVFSKVLDTDTHITVAAPRKNLNGGSPYRVIYALHGLTNNDGSWVFNSQLPLLAEKYRTVFVMPDGGRNFYIDMRYGPKYFTYISEELPVLCRDLFNLSPDREQTGVVGLSMGGYGALECALLRPDVFGFCAAFSSCCDIFELARTAGRENPELQALFGTGYEKTSAHDLYRLLESAAQAPQQCRFYGACGESDFTLDMNRSFWKAMEGKGFDCRYEESPGSHDWYFWNDALHKAMEYFFPGG